MPEPEIIEKVAEELRNSGHFVAEAQAEAAKGDYMATFKAIAVAIASLAKAQELMF